MIGFLRTKTGIVCVVIFLAIMGFMTHRVVRRPAAEASPAPVQASPAAAPAPQVSRRVEANPAKTQRPPKPVPEAPDSSASAKEKPETSAALQQTLSNLDQVNRLSKQSRIDRDRSGQPITRRKTASPAPSVDASGTKGASKNDTSPAPTTGSGLRLSGRASHAPNPGQKNASAVENVPKNTSAVPAPSEPVRTQAPQSPISTEARPARFSPYGRPIKCELVFTLDSTLEETPIVALIVEPVYNNGSLILPAGAELHGRARPDRLRDRIFSAREWMLILPREGAQPNGRQLSLVGYALDRAEPEGQGNTWGITDGSFGLQGEVIRTMNEAEIRRFAATFLAAGALTMQERQGGLRNRSVANTPANAGLAGSAAVLNDIAAEIAREIEQHGVFIRVPAGKQFYFYPQQAISPDRACLPAEAFPGEAKKTSLP